MSTAYDPLATEEHEEKTPRSSKEASNQLQRYAAHVYNFFGFKKWYNFIFFFILGGALFFFCWYEIEKIDVRGYWLKQAMPSEVFYFRLRRYSVGLQMHLGAILPGGILATLQFVPIIRHKLIIFHRLNGWLVTLLLMVSNAGAIMIVNRSFGGLLDTQVFGGILAISTTFSAWMGLINIKLKQIDQHRKWMMRAWVYAASIISLRLVELALVEVVSNIGGFFVQMHCGQIEIMGGNLTNYPSCAGGTFAAVQADVNTQVGGEEVAAAYQLTFGQSGVIAFVIHVVLLEVYFHLTPGESERLRHVAYERQLERGYKHPGSGGLTSDRLGAAPRWKPSTAYST